MKIFLAGDNGKRDIINLVHGGAVKEAVKIFLAGPHGLYPKYIAPAIESRVCDPILCEHKPYILESFYYMNKDVERLLPNFGDFMLDSGAFTFMGGFSFTDNQNGVDFEDYIQRYADFINKHKVEKFFELDVDVCVGYEKVKEYRKKIEKLTNRQPIPVWHSTRGIEDFLRCCDEYPYVALGGIVGGEWNAKAEKYIPWFINEAHKRRTKIHGLGYTKLKQLEMCHFDSVDSTAWIAGSKFGHLDIFDGRTIKKEKAPDGMRLGNARATSLHNYTEWIKFQKWADTHL